MRTSMYSAVNITYSQGCPCHLRTGFPQYPHIPEMPLIYRNVIEVNGQRACSYNIHLPLVPEEQGVLPSP